MQYKEKPIVVEQAYCTNLIGGTTTELNMLLKSPLANTFDLRPVTYNKSVRGIGFLKAICFFKKEFKKNNPDLIVIRGCEKEGLAAQLGAKLAKKGPILVGCHGLYSKIIKTTKIKHFIALKIIEPLIFKNCDYFYTVSNSVFDQYALFSKFKKKYVGTLYNAAPSFDLLNKKMYQIDFKKKYGLAENMLVGIYHGRLTYDKGMDVLINSLKMVFEQNNNICFIVLGDGQEYKEKLCSGFSTQIKEKQLIVLDQTDNVEPYLLASDFYVHPSFHDNHSISLLEACAAGCYIIATDVGGVKETVDIQNSTIVQTGDFVSIANAICSLKDILPTFNPLNWSNTKGKKFTRDKIYSDREILYNTILSK